jgi:Zn-dependent M28 family amino/carboxypeptidase
VYKRQSESSESAQLLPVPGANDGASGVAVLLELARILPPVNNNQMWLVFFDAEDQGHIDNFEWIMGSRVFVQELKQKPSRAVIIDMIGDADLQIFREHNSDIEMTDQLWRTADELGFSSYFIDEEKYNILDDHIPFIEVGIPAVDIIDFDYPWWHTLSDTADKVTPQSLEIVGKTLIKWLETNP